LWSRILSLGALSLLVKPSVHFRELDPFYYTHSYGVYELSPESSPWRVEGARDCHKKASGDKRTRVGDSLRLLFPRLALQDGTGRLGGGRIAETLEAIECRRAGEASDGKTTEDETKGISESKTVTTTV
jgi:hypothetical protein